MLKGKLNDNGKAILKGEIIGDTQLIDKNN